MLSMDLDEAVESLTNFILDAASQSIPKINIRSNRKDKLWVGNKLFHESKKRNKLFKTAKLSNDENDWKMWKNQRNLVASMNRRFKNKYVMRQVKKN